MIGIVQVKHLAAGTLFLMAGLIAGCGESNQLDNNQYLMDLARRPASGKQFGPLDVVRQQRLGTSFAVSDSDNPGPKCIISGGLGTMSVTYMGKTYSVCCSGCAAAFNDDPEHWLAKLAAREKSKKAGDE